MSLCLVVCETETRALLLSVHNICFQNTESISLLPPSTCSYVLTKSLNA